MLANIGPRMAEAGSRKPSSGETLPSANKFGPVDFEAMMTKSLHQRNPSRT